MLTIIECKIKLLGYLIIILFRHLLQFNSIKQKLLVIYYVINCNKTKNRNQNNDVA